MYITHIIRHMIPANIERRVQDDTFTYAIYFSQTSPRASDLIVVLAPSTKMLCCLGFTQLMLGRISTRLPRWNCVVLQAASATIPYISNIELKLLYRQFSSRAEAQVSYLTRWIIYDGVSHIHSPSSECVLASAVGWQQETKCPC